MDGTPVRRSNSDTINLKPADLPENGSAIQVLSYNSSCPRHARRLNGKVKGKRNEFAFCPFPFPLSPLVK